MQVGSVFPLTMPAPCIIIVIWIKSSSSYALSMIKPFSIMQFIFLKVGENVK